jgi:hypothetical protein
MILDPATCVKRSHGAMLPSRPSVSILSCTEALGQMIAVVVEFKGKAARSAAKDQ